MSELPPFHWHILTFAIPLPGTTGFQAIITGTPDGLLTMPVMSGARKQYDIPDTAVIMNVSNLGVMTREQFEGVKPPVKNEQPLTLSYMSGMIEGHSSVAKTGYVVEPNPHPEGTKQHADWVRGFKDGVDGRKEMEERSAATE